MPGFTQRERSPSMEPLMHDDSESSEDEHGRGHSSNDSIVRGALNSQNVELAR